MAYDVTVELTVPHPSRSTRQTTQRGVRLSASTLQEHPNMPTLPVQGLLIKVDPNLLTFLESYISALCHVMNGKDTRQIVFFPFSKSLSRS